MKIPVWIRNTMVQRAQEAKERVEIKNRALTRSNPSRKPISDRPLEVVDILKDLRDSQICCVTPRCTTEKRVAPITPPLATPTTPAHSQLALTATNTPTSEGTMADTQQDTDMQAPEPQGSSQPQQPAGASPSPSPKRPGLEEIRDECHPSMPYANDSVFWEAEDELFPVLTDEEINNIETAFAQSTNTLVFHLNPEDATRYNIINFREDLTSDCKYFFNITFTGTATALMAKRGYMLLPKAMILVSYQHAAHLDPPQSLNQLEYSNTDYMSPNDLRKAF
ncbi:unnamed protein product [Aphanomyces euteiches]